MIKGGVIILATIFLYLAGMILIGIYFSRHGSSESTSEFFLGGRKLGPLVTAMSAEASDMSSYLLMGLPGLAYFCGTAEVGWTAIGLAAGTYLNFLLIARKIRRYSGHINAITIPDFFSKRYHDGRHILSLVSALIIIVFFIPYTASGFKAVGTLFSSLFGTEYHLAMIIGAAVIISYTVLGGFLAVSTTDLIQSIFMSIALVVIVFFGISHAGGMANVIANAKALPGYLSLTQNYSAASGGSTPFSFFSIISTLAWGLGYFGMPHILLRFMAIRDENELDTSRRIAGVWVVLSMGIAILIGIIGYSVSLTGAIPLMTTSSDSETIIIRLANLMSGSGFFAAVIAGIIMAGILAATMSTADSQLLAAASSVSQDLVQDFMGIRLSKDQALLAARCTVAGIAAVAVILAWNPDSSVFRIVSFAWAGFGAAFGPAMILALFWRRSNMQGAAAGIAAGGIMVFVWKYLISPLGEIFAVYELLPAFLISLAVNTVVSLNTKAPEDQILQEFDAVSR